ncbi:MAG: hypothetical protein ACRDTA_05770 [Pseudonocardiaceae bacterium]
MNTKKYENVPNTRSAPKIRLLDRLCGPKMNLPRRVRVKGMQGVDATVVVTVVHDTVWLSISPPFTWEAIMEPGKVDDVISVLELARDDTMKMAAGDGSAFSGRTAVVRAITSDGGDSQ